MAYEVSTPDGRIVVTPEAVAAIAGWVAAECPGVVGMAPRGLPDGIASALGRENPGRGVQVYLEGDRAWITVGLIVAFGVRIPDVAAAVAARVRQAVGEATGLRVERVRVEVQGIRPDRRLPG